MAGVEQLRRWSTWWAFDGPDNIDMLQSIGHLFLLFMDIGYYLVPIPLQCFTVTDLTDNVTDYIDYEHLVFFKSFMVRLLVVI